MVDISTIIDITAEIETGGAPTRPFGRGLLITENDRVSAGGAGKIQPHNTLATVTAAFAADSDTVEDATVWFAATPPPQSLYIGRWARTDVATRLTGGTPEALTALAAANSAFDLNGNDVTADLSSASTYALVATAVQTVVQAVGGIFAGATFAYSNNVFVLTLAGGDEIETGALGTPTTGTDISAELGMASDSAGRLYTEGRDAESVQNAIADMVALVRDAPPVAVMLGSDAGLTDPQAANADTRLRVAAYIQGTDMVFGFNDISDQAVAANDTTSVGAEIYAASSGRSAGLYTAADRRPDIGTLALLSGQDLDQPASLITPFGKPLPGVLPTDINETQLERLAAKNMSVYTTFNGVAGLYGGFSSQSGHFVDTVWWLSWLDRKLSETVWNTHRASRRFTTALLGDALRRVMQAGIRNGGIEPGRTVPATTRADIVAATGNQAFDGVLTTGYLVYLPRPTDDDRTNRRARFLIWLASSEAVHTVSGNVKLVP